MKKTYAWSIGIAVAILGWLGSGLYFTEGRSIEPSIADKRLRDAEVAADRIPTNVKIKSSVAKEITRYSTTSGKTQNKRTVVTRTETTGKIVSIIGRYYSMDRDERWERIKHSYDLLVHGKGKATNDFKKSLISKELNESIVLDGEIVSKNFQELMRVAL